MGVDIHLKLLGRLRTVGPDLKVYEPIRLRHISAGNESDLELPYFGNSELFAMMHARITEKFTMPPQLVSDYESFAEEFITESDDSDTFGKSYITLLNLGRLINSLLEDEETEELAKLMKKYILRPALEMIDIINMQYYNDYYNVDESIILIAYDN